ncbi:MAG: hypothetical protein GKR88_04575 [Flavobacteriaceae bacterium]|nr:MAG: hypothetical protein GKR88_04575 [Flavobacteriaceae bacterium]
MNVDNAADEYVRWPPYSFGMNNPIFFIDPDGQRIKIGDHYYSYEKDRDYDAIEDEFERNTYKAIDQLYSSDTMNITIGEGENAETINVLDVLINDKDNDVTIVKGESNKYDPNTDTVKFKDTHGAYFRKDAGKAYGNGNTGRNSASSLLAHELIHNYNDVHDNKNYRKRKADKSTKKEGLKTPKGADLSFSNAEEKYTITLTNQVNEKLKQDKRTNYGRGYYPTESPTTTEPKKKKQ